MMFVNPIENVLTPMILLPGMGADRRLFRLQTAEFPGLVIPPWLEPGRREPLGDYARRLGRAIDPGKPCFVGGASFGGIVALEMAVAVQAHACFLIASVRSRSELPWHYRALRPLVSLEPDHLGRIALLCSRFFGRFLQQSTALRLSRFADPRSTFLRWASWAVLNWRPSAQLLRLKVYQIHGSADRTIPIRNVRPDVVVAGGGHVLPLSHPSSVNNFLRRHIAEHEQIANEKRRDKSRRGRSNGEAQKQHQSDL